jgi:transcription factor TFIIIB component B''
MEWTPTAPPKKPRKPRKDRGQKRKSPDAQAEEGAEGNEPEDASPAEVRPTKRKRAPRKPRTPASNGVNGERMEGEVAAQRRRGRERETTPEDAEHRIVDPEETFLDSLASRSFRIGKLSQRERQMREVNWEEVKERRRKENALEIPRLKTKEEKEAEANAQEAAEHEQEQQRQAPAATMKLVNGVLVMDNSAARNGGGEDDVEDGDVIEEHDLTTRITTNSFMRENKRNPKEFMLAGQGKRWNAEMTERFYDALQIFGTDFNMIQTLFKDVTRRSIKLKFNREERENPELIKAALNGQRKSNWEEFLSKSEYTDAHFIDPRALEAELEAMRQEKQPEIDEARAKAEERRRQRRLAGLPEEEEDEAPNGAGDKEGGKKKRRQRGQAVQWEAEEGVEVLDDAGEDWG